MKRRVKKLRAALKEASAIENSTALILLCYGIAMPFAMSNLLGFSVLLLSIYAAWMTLEIPQLRANEKRNGKLFVRAAEMLHDARKEQAG